MNAVKEASVERLRDWPICGIWFLTGHCLYTWIHLTPRTFFTFICLYLTSVILWVSWYFVISLWVKGEVPLKYSICSYFERRRSNSKSQRSKQYKSKVVSMPTKKLKKRHHSPTTTVPTTSARKKICQVTIDYLNWICTMFSRSSEVEMLIILHAAWGHVFWCRPVFGHL